MSAFIGVYDKHCDTLRLSRAGIDETNFVDLQLFNENCREIAIVEVMCFQ